VAAGPSRRGRARVSTCERLACGALVLAALLLAGVPAAAQNITTNEAPPKIPFEAWVSAGEAQQIPMSLDVARPRLSILQRMFTQFRVIVPGKALRGLGLPYQLFLVLRLKLGSEWIEEEAVIGTRLQEQLPKGGELEFTIGALVQPGEYTVAVVLWERVSGRRSVTLRRLRVAPIAHDPLPNIARDLPRVEFLQQAVGPNRDFRPELKSRLWLPVATRRPVRLEVLVNFTPSEQYSGSRSVHAINAATMLGMLKVLSQLELSNGSLHVTALDLLRRNVLFEQRNVRELEWIRLRRAIQEANPLTIPLKALERRRENPAFFREVLRSRLLTPANGVTSLAPSAAGPGGNGTHSAPAAVEPFRVFLVVSSPMLFTHGADLAPLPREGDCNCRVYHLQYRVAPSNLWDELPRVMRELEPRRFRLESPMDFRRALAQILADLHQM